MTIPKTVIQIEKDEWSNDTCVKVQSKW